MDVTHYALLAGPFVGRTSLSATALALRDAGARVTEPDPHASYPDALPGLAGWAEEIERQIPDGPPPIVVGYSAASVLAAWLAPRIGAAGIVFLDGDIPAEGGPEPILPARVSDMLRGRDRDGDLPAWSDWWRDPGLAEGLGLGPLRRDRADLVPLLRAEERCFPAAWLDQRLEMPRWSNLPTGYVRLSPFFDAQADSAEARGWPVARVDGSHLHPVLNGVETAGALMAVAGEFGAR